MSPRMCDGGARRAMLAVPTVTIEKDEMGLAIPGGDGVDSDESLHGRAPTATLYRIQVHDPHDDLFDVSPTFRLSACLSCLRSSLRVSGRARARTVDPAHRRS